MRRVPDLERVTVPILMILLLVPLQVNGARAGARELDPAAVFCACYSLSGKRLEDRDIEDLCWNMGRPTFSAFKPAEMFSRRALTEARRALQNGVDRIGPDTVFRWGAEAVLVREPGGGLSFRSGVDRTDLPQATPLIQAEIAPAGWKRLQRALERLPSSSQGTALEGARLGILLEPLRVEDRMDRRNIALEEVTIPVRVVVFEPVAVEVRHTTHRSAIPVSP